MKSTSNFPFPFLSFQNLKFWKLLYFVFFSKVQKVKYLPHLLSNRRNFFSESSYGKYLQVQNDRKGAFLRGTSFWLIYLKSFKKITFESCYFNFNFFAVFSKMRQSISTIPVILSFMKFFVSQTSRTRFFLQLL